MVSVMIPNAVVAENFQPHDADEIKHRNAPGPPQPLGPEEMITIVVI